MRYLSSAFTGVVLAGGASRRMGQDKALLQVDGVTMLDHSMASLKAIGADPIVVLGRGTVPGGIPDLQPLEGPAVAIQTYLANAEPNTRHIFMPVDMPNLGLPLLKRLSQENTAANFALHPLPCLLIAGAGKQKLVRRIRDLLKMYHSKELLVPAGMNGSFINMNTPRDYSNHIQRKAAATQISLDTDLRMSI